MASLVRLISAALLQYNLLSEVGGRELSLTAMFLGPKQMQHQNSRLCLNFRRQSVGSWRFDPILVTAVILLAFGTATSGHCAETEHPLRSVDTSSPRATLQSFVAACNEYYNLVRDHGRAYGNRQSRYVLGSRILRCLDLSQIAPAVRDHIGAESAICLKEILDRIPMPPEWEIPGELEVTKAAASDGLQRWTIPDTEITLVLMSEEARKGEYLFSAATVERALGFYERVKDLPYKKSDATPHFLRWYRTAPGWMIPASLVHGLPWWMQTPIGSHAPWQWIGLILTLTLASVLMAFGFIFGQRILRSENRLRIVRYGVSLVFPIVAVLIPKLTNYFIANQLGITGNVQTILSYTLDIIFLLAAIIAVMTIGNRAAEWLISSPHIHPRGIDAHLIRLGLRFVSLVMATVLFLEGGQRMGIPLTTLVAGAGVGGLAFALAAQDTVKNFFGSVMVLLDKPFGIGDRIAVKQYDGVVEEIGLRSTRIRLLTGHLVTLPNEEMARIDIENISRRPHIRRSTSIRLRYDTPPDKVEQAVSIVRQILDAHEGSDPKYPPRVFLNEFNADSLNLRIILWYHPPMYWNFLAFCQRVNLQIIQQFKMAGIEFALPANTAFLAQDPQHPLATLSAPADANSSANDAPSLDE